MSEVILDDWGSPQPRYDDVALHIPHDAKIYIDGDINLQTILKLVPKISRQY